MTIFEYINEQVKDIDKFVDWLDKYWTTYDSPWIKWWDDNYCKKCESEETYVAGFNRECNVAWCELNKGCKFFKEIQAIPNDKQIIKMWLKSECEIETRKCPDCIFFVGCETARVGVVCDAYNELEAK